MPLGNCRKCLIPKELCKTKSGLPNPGTAEEFTPTPWSPRSLKRRRRRIAPPPLRVLAAARPYQQAGAPSLVTAAFGAFANGPVKMPQFVGVLVTAGFVIVAFQPAAST